jgi:hypothetical protein
MPLTARPRTFNPQSDMEARMTSEVTGAQGGVPWRLVGWGGAVALILAPLVAMQAFPESGVNWTASDFLFAILMIGGVGLLFELGIRASRSWAYRGGIALGLAAGFLAIWINLAVGIVGNEDNPINLVFMGVVALGIAGALVARGEARLMVRAMVVPAVVQAAIGATVFVFNASAEPPGRVGLLILIEGFALLWLGSALLFRRAGGAGA